MIPLCYTTVSFAKYRYLSGFIKTKIIYLGCSSATDCKETKKQKQIRFHKQMPQHSFVKAVGIKCIDVAGCRLRI